MRCTAVFVVVAALAETSAARSLSLDQLAAAPLLVVGRVEAIAERRRLPGSNPRYPQYAGPAIATVRVIRAFLPLDKNQIRLSYYGLGARAVVDGPGEPVLRVNNVYILPVKSDGTGWSVVEKPNIVTILPGVARSTSTAPAATAKAFLLREVANVLLSGSVEDMFDIAEFLKFQPSRGLMGEVMAELHLSLAPESVRFLEVAAVFFASALTSKADIVNLPSERASVNRQIASLLLHDIPKQDAIKRVARILIRWIGDPSFPYRFVPHIHTTLTPEFNSELADLLSEELQSPQQGSIYAASWLAESGEHSLLSASTAAAIRALRMRNIVGNDLVAAGRLIVNYGDEAQFESYLQALTQARIANDTRYDSMWRLAESQKGPRVIRILTSILQDERLSRRSTDHGLRYCDAAGLRLQQAVGVNFGFRHFGVQNAAVSRARRWVAANRAMGQ